MKYLLSLVFILICVATQAQIITSDPAFPSQEDVTTIFYDSNLGNGELIGVSPVYMHTGVITSNSTSPTDWQHVIGNWGTADAQVLMTDEGGGVHSFTYPSAIEDWYGVNAGEEVSRLSFVFRNANGTSVGREEDGSDIFYDLSDGSFSIVFQAPSAESILIDLNETVDFSAASTLDADISILVNDVLETSETGVTSIEASIQFTEPGSYTVLASAEAGGEVVTDQVEVIIVPEPITLSPPVGIEDGINYTGAESVVLQLYAPNKNNVFVLGDFNNWSFSLDYLMNLAPDGETYWLELSDLNPNTEYRFQYAIDNDLMRVADIYTEKVLDPWNDPFIPAETIANVTPYPTSLTSEAVSVFQINQEEFSWTDQDFSKPESARLNIYELLVRDFTEEQNYQTVIDTLDYLERLGINALQLMPINEFEGNLSWGYNPSFFFAADKYYGGEEKLKELVDECHDRGMAVTLDIALNHSFGQNPQVRMYFNADAGQFGQPTSESPWFNEIPKHDFNVGYDYNHESPKTVEFCERVLQYWVDEYHIDGYRMDLSKGFTQVNSLGNVGFWGQYDQSRVNILNNYKEKVLQADPEAYFILEHFANNDEESALSDQGHMLWGNINHEFNEATMGYSSNLNWASYQQRGWEDPNLISFMESHDEERLMYKNLLFGNSSGSYDITELQTALDRVELATVFLYSIPGPKMAWQFGELGYDYSINYCPDGTINEDCRTAEKPVRWDYQQEEGRTDLYEVTSIMNYLRNTYDFMHTDDYNISVGGFGKRINLNGDINATIIGNFNVIEASIIPNFQSTGTWYELFTGEEIIEENLSNAFTLQPGEFRFYTDEPLSLSNNITERENTASLQFSLWPNPSNGAVTISQPDFSGEVSLTITDMLGKVVLDEDILFITNSNIELDLTDQLLEEGIYIISMEKEGVVNSQKLIVSAQP
ncbi:MAG: alpha-amylase family glycosyl hydrolase [Flavobacteriales bacterium]